MDCLHFVGLSPGGMTRLRLAAREPGRVSRLTVHCTSAHMPPASSWTGRAADVRARGTAAVAGTLLDRWFTPAYRDQAAAHQMLESTLRRRLSRLLRGHRGHRPASVRAR